MNNGNLEKKKKSFTCFQSGHHIRPTSHVTGLHDTRHHVEDLLRRQSLKPSAASWSPLKVLQRINIAPLRSNHLPSGREATKRLAEQLVLYIIYIYILFILPTSTSQEPESHFSSPVYEAKSRAETPTRPRTARRESSVSVCVCVYVCANIHNIYLQLIYVMYKSH